MTTRFALPALLALLLGTSAPLSAQELALDYQVTIDYEIFETDTPDTYFQLTGQSAYIQFRPTSRTSGGQLDSSRGPGTGSIVFTEFFPPDDISDFLAFAYFGLVQTRSSLDDSVIDTSFVFASVPFAASRSPVPTGTVFQDFFPSYTESEVVDALQNSFDSPIFLDLLGTQIPSLANGQGTIAIPEIGRPGDTMDLIAFIGGNDGSSGFRIGTLGTTVALVPEPSSALLAACAAIGLLRRRRESIG